MITKGNKRKNLPPFDYRNNDSVGKYQGIGIPAQVAQKDGGYTEIMNRKNRLPKDKPPRKFN